MRSADSYVVDASVAVKWHLVDEDDAEQALAIWRGFNNGEFALLAPEHIRYEAPNAISQATLRSPARLTRDEGRQAVAEFLASGLTTFSDSDLIAATIPLVYEFGCAFYDAVYVALSQRMKRPFITADARLYQRVRLHTDTIWIGDWPL